MQIREFIETDIDAVQQLIYHTIDISYRPVYPPRAIEFFKEFHSDAGIMERYRSGKIFVVEQDGDIIGTGSFVNGEILGVFINPGFQGKGYGKTLMLALERTAVFGGCSEVTLSVSLPSKGFYEGLGYNIIKECSIDVGKGEYLNYWSAKKSIAVPRMPDK
jgi:ribosomal protein S18 acetylase RimI-like enzyme